MPVYPFVHLLFPLFVPPSFHKAQGTGGSPDSCSLWGRSQTQILDKANSSYCTSEWGMEREYFLATAQRVTWKHGHAGGRGGGAS